MSNDNRGGGNGGVAIVAIVVIFLVAAFFVLKSGMLDGITGGGDSGDTNINIEMPAEEGSGE